MSMTRGLICVWAPALPALSRTQPATMRDPIRLRASILLPPALRRARSDSATGEPHFTTTSTSDDEQQGDDQPGRRARLRSRTHIDHIAGEAPSARPHHQVARLGDAGCLAARVELTGRTARA